jgi:E1A/CREB-binding protein
VLSHYHRCKQRNCEVCAPVRLAIQKQNNQKRPSSKKSKSKKAAKAPPQVTVKPPEPQKQKPRMPTQQSLIDTWSHATIQAHLENLNRLFNPYYTKQVMKDSMLPLLKKLTEEEYGWIFNKPVDPLELGLPDYFDIISKPMDLGTVRKNLEKGKYKLPAAVSDDVNLCFDNAMKYNPDDSEVYQLALRFKKIFMKSFRIEASSLREKEHKQRENENSCKLCGGEMFQFEPPVYYCNGTCGTRIRRNSYYHVTPDNKGHYCMQCYGKLDETIQVGENVIRKDNVHNKKNDDNTEESWVQCETCDGWMHQICAVFNSRQNDNDDAEIKYTCAVCLAKQREHLGENVPPPKKGTLPYLSAKELPKTELSNFLEKRVRTLEKEYGEAHPELKVPETTLRVVSHKTNPCYTKVEMHKEYCDAEGYPTQFDYISKCILMFQNLDGVEVLLFGFYIQEYDDECPELKRPKQCKGVTTVITINSGSVTPPPGASAAIAPNAPGLSTDTKSLNDEPGLKGGLVIGRKGREIDQFGIIVDIRSIPDSGFRPPRTPPAMAAEVKAEDRVLANAAAELTTSEIDAERQRLMLQRNEGFRYSDESHEVFNLRMRLGHPPTEGEITTELQRLERLRST